MDSSKEQMSKNKKKGYKKKEWIENNKKKK